MSQTNTKVQSLGSSFRDPSGFLFRKDGVLYRQVNQVYKEDYHQLMDSGLYNNLVGAGLLIAHQEAPLDLALNDSAYKVIHPEPVTFISYPYEWCFSQLQDAAITILKIQKRALEFGMILKDGSAYNIQFQNGRTILIDTLSFETYHEGSPWDAYRQFCQHFLAPLSLMSYRDIRLGQLLRVYIDGIPLDLASRLLPARSRLSVSLLMHIHLHTASQAHFADKQVKTKRKVSKRGLLGLIDSLELSIRRLRWSPKGTEWGSYYDVHNYTQDALRHKQQTIAHFLVEAKPAIVWDLGANVGIFSRLASEMGISTIAFDIDPGAVELNYQECISKGEKKLLPLLLDLTNPSPSIGWNNEERIGLIERGPADAVLALALIHHLAISNNVPLDRLAGFFHQLCKWLIIEFIPKSDSQVQRLLSTRKDIFVNYNLDYFEYAFEKYFTIRTIQAIQDSVRCLYLMEAH
jgi:hypothetical protein